MARKYDVAFSFLTADLPLALRLEDALKPLSSFVYARKQEEIILGDGMEAFSAAFDTESRLNVVLYRAGYGDRGWTNFEKEIIRGRWLSEGFGSFSLIRTDDSPVPGWIPPAYIYGDASLMDVEALAGVIRVRAKTAGATVEPQTAATRLGRLASDRQFNDETERLGTGREAFDAVSANLSAVHRRIAAVLAEHAGRGSGLESESGGAGSTIFGANLGHTGCFINYRNQFGTVTHGAIKIRIFNGRIDIPGSGRIYMEQASEADRFDASVIRSRALGWCWMFGDQPHTSEEVADFVLDELMKRNR